MRKLLQKPGEGSGMLYAGGTVLGESSYMYFIDDKILCVKPGHLHITPVEIILHDAGFVVLSPGRYRPTGSDL